MRGRGGGQRGEGTGRGGEGELSAGLPAAEQPLLAGGGGGEMNGASV